MTIKVHPSSLIDPGAKLAEGCEIGPFCSIGERVVIGKNTKVYANCHVLGNTKIGENNEIFHGSIIGGMPQDLKFNNESSSSLIIGDNNKIREYVTIHSSVTDQPTRIGNSNLLMANAHVAHDCQLGNFNILANTSLLAGHVTLENHIQTGGAVAFHQFTKVGDYSFLAAGAMVAQDVPPFCMAAGDRARLNGLNLIGLKRRGFNPDEIKELKGAYRHLFFKKDGVFAERLEQALAKESWLQRGKVKEFLDFIVASRKDGRRGVCPSGRS